MSEINLKDCLAVFCGATFLSYMGVAFLRYWTLRKNVLDIPNERSMHKQPTPRGGGLIITLLILSAWLPFALLLGIPNLNQTHWKFIVGGGAIAGVSWLDDLRGLSFKVRLLVHGLAAGLMLHAVGGWETILLPWLGEVHLGWAGGVLAFIWIVGFTNAFNFMDGIDGIAGGQALVSGLGWALIASLNHQPNICALSLLIAAGSFGFLFHNWSPAKIFMGDVGSAFLGFVLAVLPLIALSEFGSATITESKTLGYDPLSAGLMVWPFVCDATFTFIRRGLKGENVFAAHRSHLYQRLALAGWSHRQVSSLYICLALTGVLMAYAWRMGCEAAPLGVPILFLTLLWRVRRQEQGPHFPPQGEQVNGKERV